MYQVISEAEIIRFENNGKTLWIPMDKANTDYQLYLQWLAEGNEPEIIDLSNDII